MTQDPHKTSRFAAAVFERYQRGLMRFLMRRLGTPQDSSDMAQEVYLRLLRLENTELVRRPQAYVYSIASHVVSQFRLKTENEHVTFDPQSLESVAIHSDEDQLAERLDAERQVRRMLDVLPELHRAVLVLRKRDGLSHPEIAEELNISTHTVKRYLHEAQVRIRSMDWKD